MFVKLFEIIILMFVVDFLPAALTVFLLRKLLKKKLSKGLCIVVFVFCSFISYTLVSLIAGHSVKLGLFDMLIPFMVISLFLYDREISDKNADTQTVQK